MPVPSAPSGLTHILFPDDGNVGLWWTNVGGSLTGSKIEKTLDGGATWTTEYDGALLTTRKVWPVPNQGTGYRVYSKNASGYSAASSPVFGVFLGLHGSFQFPMSLVSTADSTKKVLCLGAGSFASMPGLQQIRQWTDLAPAGAADRQSFVSVQLWRDASVTFTIPSYSKADGTRVLATDVLDTLESLEGPTLLFRDAARGMSLYCTIRNIKPVPITNGVWAVSFDIKSALAPALPLTS